MCYACMMRAMNDGDERPWEEIENSVGQSDNALPVFTMDQIANQLGSGFWGGPSYAWDVGVGDSLVVDLAGLNQAGQEMARQALDAWEVVTGLNFVEVSSADEAPTGTVSEGPDASSGTSTAYSVSVGQDFEGALEGGPDRDAIAITLDAGEKITLKLKGDGAGGNALADPHLRLRDSSGNTLMENTAQGGDAVLSFQAETAGTYYLQAGALNDATLGDYRIEVRAANANADITFDDNFSGAYASFSTSGTRITNAFINIDDNWAGGQSRTDGYFFQTYLHEVGHALGLGHAGNYNGNASYPN
ncbi:MAG: matrixin family metalloprotease, partial [Pseudomonadota bacterium]